MNSNNSNNNSSGIRHRHAASSDADSQPSASGARLEEAAKVVRQLDVFTKLPSDCRSSGTASGAGITLITFVLMFLLVCVEVNNYLERQVQFSYGVDPDHSSELAINVDLLVASPCQSVGMDVLDITGTETHGKAEIEEIPTDFELDESSRARFAMRRHVQEAIRLHHHALQSDLFADGGWRHLLPGAYGPDQFQSPAERKAQSACRLRGRFRVNKVAGNLHLTGGKPVNFGGTHAHFQASHATALNFSHRIYHLSFGDDVPGRINPLDYEEKVTQQANMNYQYFVQVVPTELRRRGLGGVLHSYQYAVQELDRVIDHGRGSHGLPGLFFKYEVSPLQVRVADAGLPLSSFLTNLAAIVGGVFASSAVLCYAVNALAERLACVVARKRGSSHLPVAQGNQSVRYASPLS